MALYQEGLVVLPRAALDFQDEWKEENLALCEKLWAGKSLQADVLIGRLDAFIARAEWANSEDHISWKGDVDKHEDNDVSLVFGEQTGIVSHFSFRFDLRSTNLDFLRRMIDLCQENDLVFLSDQKGVMEASLEHLPEIIGSSAYRKFLTDPEKFLEELSNKQKQEKPE
ncbi:MAG: hypothetical protein AAFV95_20845 [Bacteroidota bacterium]